MSSLSELGLMRLPQVLAVFPVCKSKWWKGVKSGEYPKPVKISARCTAWKAEDIRKLIERLSERATTGELPIGTPPERR